MTAADYFAVGSISNAYLNVRCVIVSGVSQCVRCVTACQVCYSVSGVLITLPLQRAGGWVSRIHTTTDRSSLSLQTAPLGQVGSQLGF